MTIIAVRVVLIIYALVVGSLAQTLSAQNYTSENNIQRTETDVFLAISNDGRLTTAVGLGSITGQATSDLTMNGRSGPALLVDASTSLGQNSPDIALISCDASDYTGYIHATDVVSNAEQAKVPAIVFYSQQADYCIWQPTWVTNFPWMYTLQSRNDTQLVLDKVRSSHINITVYSDPTRTSGGAVPSTTQIGATTSPTSFNNPGGPPPSTAVAMIILYSITGIITILFLAIIITGGIRAHRNPDRYGPRNLIGGTRQSRAKGLARAMLDGLPIVKFGERENQKAGDVELASGETRDDSPSTSVPEQSINTKDTAPTTITETPSELPQAVAAPEAEPGIAAAAQMDTSDDQGCSICTEDFEIGQDQRVLPCNHRFHPACIDPWLLDVSGTCPLCRIDLRPQSSHDAYDEEGNPIPPIHQDINSGLAPPLNPVGGPTDRERPSIRRSIMLSIIGMAPPERMSRQQRVGALREYRREREREEARAGVPNSNPPMEDEPSTRRRLRNVFRVRTHRTLPAAVDGTGQPSSEAAREMR